jgi:hypothetical protein
MVYTSLHTPPLLKGLLNRVSKSQILKDKSEGVDTAVQVSQQVGNELTLKINRKCIVLRWKPGVQQFLHGNYHTVRNCKYQEH